MRRANGLMRSLLCTRVSKDIRCPVRVKATAPSSTIRCGDWPVVSQSTATKRSSSTGVSGPGRGRAGSAGSSMAAKGSSVTGPRRATKVSPIGTEPRRRP